MLRVLSLPLTEPSPHCSLHLLLGCGAGGGEFVQQLSQRGGGDKKEGVVVGGGGGGGGRRALLLYHSVETLLTLSLSLSTTFIALFQSRH